MIKSKLSVTLLLQNSLIWVPAVCALYLLTLYIMAQYIPKDYVSVSDRIDQFHEKFPNGAIETSFTLNGEIVYFTAKVIPDADKPLRAFTGSSFGELTKEKSFEKLETVAV